jgi:hypothetical protein
MRAMSTGSCQSCGAKLYAGQSWCGQCFAAVGEPPGSSAADDPAAVPPPLSARMPAPREPAHVATYSRWRGGPTSFGPAGRIVLSVLAVLLGIVGYPMSRGLMVASVGFDVPGTGYVLMYAVVAVVAEVYLFSRIWKRERIR